MFTLTHRHIVEVHVHELFEILPVNADPRLDRLIREGFDIEFDLKSKQPSVRARLSKECVLGMDDFSSYVWSIEILRDGQTIFEDSRRFDVTLDEDGPWGSAVAPFALSSDVLPLVMAASTGDDEARWSIQFRMDPEQMLLWTYRPDLTYWDGVIERTINWNTPSNSAR